MTYNPIQDILAGQSDAQKRALFEFESTTASVAEIVLKFNLWGRHLFPKYYKTSDAWFHADIDTHNTEVFLGLISSFTDIAFRGAAKTTRTKLFFAFWIANDKDKSRRYLKILSEDDDNAKQSVTDIYNMLIDPRMTKMYPEIFAKTTTKREERMESFTTATGIKLKADTVGSSQRGQLQDESRPDVVWFDDFETMNTIKSAVKTVTIWGNMDEARQGLARGGACIYTCNYISERGNVHKLVEAKDANNIVLIIPIIEKGVIAWPENYTLEDINKIEKDALDYAGDYLCKPSASKDVMIDREKIDAMLPREPIRTIGGFRQYFKFDRSHRYGIGGDVAGGVGLDSSASVAIDFTSYPAQVVGAFDDNEIKPDVFGDELKSQGDTFGGCIIAPENNKFDMCVLRLRQIYDLDKIYRTQKKGSKETTASDAAKDEFGWNTNVLTKPTMIFAFCKAVNDGHLILNDERLIKECRAYTRNDLMDREVDVRMVTRHFDLFIAACIAWQLNAFAEPAPEEEKDEEPVNDSAFADIGL